MSNNEKGLEPDTEEAVNSPEPVYFEEEPEQQVDVEVNDVQEVVVEEEEVNAKPCISKPTNKDKSVGNYAVGIPASTLTEFTDALKRFSEILSEKNPSHVKWKETSEEALEFYTPNGLYQDRLDSNEADWQQGVTTPSGDVLGMSSIAMKSREGELKGEIALLKVAKRLGMGDVVNVMLPHSGIWVTVKPPTDRDLIDFYNTVFREKVAFGTATSGLGFTNFSVHMNNRLFEFISRHIHNLSYSDMPKDQLGNYMTIHDFPFLVHGFAKSMYPNGFDYSRACNANLDECTHVSEQTLDLDTMTYIDNNSLTKTQRNILSNNRPNSNTLETYRTFKSEHPLMVGSSYRTSNGFKFNFKIPTFNEYTTDGLAWISGISTIVENLMVVNETDEEDKKDILTQYIKASILRQFNHFVESIELDENEVVVDRDTINGTLELFSSDDELRAELTKAIIDFKSKTTLGVIGIDKYTCPSCQKEQLTTETLPVFKQVIPIDSVNLFFLLLTSKISKILERDM